MSALRFASAREVFEAFPTARGDMLAEPTEDPPFRFVRALLDSPTPEDAVTFCAYLLPRREAVWWACQCLRALNPNLSPADAQAVAAAEAWVREPEEDRRRAALAIGMQAQRKSPAIWAALAAAWSGGSMVDGDYLVPAPPDLTAKAARAAVLTALAGVGAKERASHLVACLEGAMRLVGEQPASA